MLYNFSSFEGMNVFDFSIADETKNIILIGGKNGAGKTSLFMAIKIALYGPLAFGYVSNNSHYTAKIKECINSRAFQSKYVEAEIQISFSLMVEREIKEYTITREWNYSSQKLLEKFEIRTKEKVLDEEEKVYFQNYLMNLMPPDLFEFFFFDGEEVGSVFSSSAYNTYVRNAIYTLCGLDVYEIIRKYTRGFAGKASNEEEEVLLTDYDALKEAVETCEAKKIELDDKLEALKSSINNIDTQLYDLAAVFKNAGGITKDEKEVLGRDYAAAEKIKAESTAKIKLFVEGVMPFFIVKGFIPDMLRQLDQEEQEEIFSYIRRKIDVKDIRNAISASVSEDILNQIIDIIIERFRPAKYETATTQIFNLSKEERSRIDAMVASIEGFDIQEMVRTIENKRKASERTIEINKIFKNAMDEDEAVRYTEQENSLLKERDLLRQELFNNESEIERNTETLADLTEQKDRLWLHIKENTQNKHIIELTKSLSDMMDSLLGEKTVEIRKQLERRIVENLNHIYRKNNLITHIEIDEKFQMNLYQDAVYTSGELANLIKNLGKSSFLSLIGLKGQQFLMDKYQVSSLVELQRQLFIYPEEEIQLYNKIDLNRLSRGERQIFILSLYWAIISMAEKDIPFVIDTPYARIDANHRREISEKFFPNISKQVIILSTDEEVNEEYYHILKPHVAREYLLTNDENQNRTFVREGYFFEA